VGAEEEGMKEKIILMLEKPRNLRRSEDDKVNYAINF
jgi:hypothetical protein